MHKINVLVWIFISSKLNILMFPKTAIFFFLLLCKNKKFAFDGTPIRFVCIYIYRQKLYFLRTAQWYEQIIKYVMCNENKDFHFNSPKRKYFFFTYHDFSNFMFSVIIWNFIIFSYMETILILTLTQQFFYFISKLIYKTYLNFLK